MVTLNAGGSGDASSTNPASNDNNNFGATSSARSMVGKGNHPLTQRRRRVGKGTISGSYSAGGGSSGYNKGGAADSGSQKSATIDPVKGDASSDMNSNAPANNSSSSSSTTGGNQPQHSSGSSTAVDVSVAPAHTAPTVKVCHSGRMSIVCCQGAMRMGARAQLGLCPPGRPRRTLQAALRQRTRASSSSTQQHLNNNTATSQASTSKRLAVSSSVVDPAGYYSLERMIGPQSLEGYEDQEEDYLLSTNTFDVESDEEASSGDEDELSTIDALLAPESPGLDFDSDTKYGNLREPLFTPAGSEGSMSNPNGGPSMMSGMGSGASGKLPFNRRKIRYFDGITAPDRQAARSYLTQEADKSRRRSALLLTRHLRRMQKQERKKRRQQKGEAVAENDSDSENEDPKEMALIQGGVAQFEQPMTAAMSAALILESLSLNPVESVEGMSKCYDGIVTAGVALIEAQHHDPMSPSSDEHDGKERAKTSRADVLAALAPLLITSLEQPSGDVIVMLARMRRMCGTARYQRRFVQRVAPCLVRPKNAAMWCLRHQHDMEPIVAAIELVLDSAHEIFSKGWYEKGRLFLADSKRAETLSSAAAQLRNLSGEPASEALSLGMASATHSHGIRRYSTAAYLQKDQTKTNDNLAEWEIMAVDKEIHLTISKILSSDWNRVTLNSKDSDSVRSFRRGASGKRPSVLPQSTSGDASPRAMMISPRSPGRPHGAKFPLSPPPPKDYSSSGPSADSLFGDMMPPQPPSAAVAAERSLSPDNDFVQQGSSPMATSPLATNRKTAMDDNDSKPAALIISKTTPPRSPKSPMRDGVEQAPPLPKPTPPVAQTPFTPVSPRRSIALSPPSSQNSREESKESAPFTPTLGASPSAPLSPSSVGSSTAELVSYRPSSGSSVISTGSGASQTAHYRTLTSTASERKRTVAACRALRAQITRFEDAFIQLHGRAPKGAAERAPLATTYSQYREWKRAIRADAACRIQALFRGARTRWILIRSDDTNMSRVIQNRAGRRDHPGGPSPRGMANQENLLNQIGIPVEIGETGDLGTTSALKPSLSSSIGSVKAPPPNSDSFPGQATSQSLAPQWASQVVRRRAGSGDRTPDGFPTTIVPSALPVTTTSPPPTTPSGGATVSLAKLQTRKRELKQELKKYDMDFARKHGRMPVKAEKEPIRNLYESYNQLKSQITMMEQEGLRHAPASTLQPMILPVVAPVAPPPSRMLVAPPTPPDSSTDSDRSIDSSGLVGGRVKRKHNIRSPPVSSTSTPAGAPSQDLAALKEEKAKLHQMLRSYEKDFFKEHQRQVSSFADIKPVAIKYRRYKEIKKAIAALQGSSDR